MRITYKAIKFFTYTTDTIVGFFNNSFKTTETLVDIIFQPFFVLYNSCRA